MTTTFITRHPGAIEWTRSENLLPENVAIAATFDPETTQPGDLIIGTLPAQISARICERGGRYQHLSLDLPEHLRGKELSADEMRACHARLEELYIQRSDVHAFAADEVRPNIHIVLATGENLPNLIPTLHPSLKPSRVCIVATPLMLKDGVVNKLRHGLMVATKLPETSLPILQGCPEQNLTEIIAWANQIALQLVQENKDSRLILNLTGGNKLMTVGFLQAFRTHAEIIYCDTGHGHIDFFHPIGKPRIKLQVNLLKLEPYLAVQGYKVRENHQDTKALEARADLTRLLAENADKLERLVGKLNKAAYFYGEGKTDQAWVDFSNNPLEQKIAEHMLKLGLLKKIGTQYQVAHSTAESYLKGGWLEEWCWQVFKALEQGEDGKKIHPNRWGINQKIDHWDYLPIPGRDQFSLNELDAVLIHRNRMLLIECKSGVQISERGESQSILNKLEALGKHVGGRLDTKWLLSARKIEGNSQAKQRADKYKIKIIYPEQLKDLKKLTYLWLTA
ncbi:MAG: hypothetical protein RIR18_592 [Pseudomonadota bacterium]|jgi:putative CRISPR-associated protein (TIGR02620 family)